MSDRIINIKLITMEVTESDKKSWSLFDSLSQSISSDHFQDAFEEIDNCNSSKSLESDSSYEVIDEQFDNTPQQRNTDKGDPRNLSNIDPLHKSITDSIDSRNYDEASGYIENISKSMLNTEQKQQEINRFESLLRRFDKWFFEQRERRYMRDRSFARGLESDESEVPTCRFLVHNSSINAFVLPFSDIYVNIVTNKQSLKYRVQSLFAEYLREVEPQSLTTEYDFKSRKNNKKLIFKFAGGSTKFMISIGLDFRIRLNQYIKLCANIDQRFLTIGTVASYWAYQRGIFNEKYLNPYALYFMIIYFLMTHNPSILPKFDEDDLQKISFSKPAFSGYKTRSRPLVIYTEKTSTNSSKTCVNTDKCIQEKENDSSVITIAELVKQFFFMYAYEVIGLRKMLSVNKGCPIDCGRIVYGYSIEDPFNPQYDLCKNLNDNRCKGYKTVKAEFERAYFLISEGKMEELCMKSSH